MRTLVTGGGNPHGQAIVKALLASGHHVRVFGGEAHDMDAFHGHGGSGELSWVPGDVRIGGSIEPALSERQALIHAQPMDPAGDDKSLHAVRLVDGGRYVRYAAEREQVDHLILVTPSQPARAFAQPHEAAIQQVQAVRGVMNHAILRAGNDPATTAKEVLAMLAKLPELGKQPGRENDAVTA